MQFLGSQRTFLFTSLALGTIRTSPEALRAAVRGTSKAQERPDHSRGWRVLSQRLPRTADPSHSQWSGKREVGCRRHCIHICASDTDDVSVLKMDPAWFLGSLRTLNCQCSILRDHRVPSRGLGENMQVPGSQMCEEQPHI